MSEPTVAELQARVALLERALRLAAEDNFDFEYSGECPAHVGYRTDACVGCPIPKKKGLDWPRRLACWCDYYISEAAKEVIPQ